MIEQALGNFFKTEIKAAGRKLFNEEKISITGGSDTTILVHVRASPPLKVLLQSKGVSSPTFTADCSCPAGKKAQFCKHVWGGLIGVEAKFPDFLSGKRSIEKSEADPDAKPESSSYAETAKARASEYRKEQYQKQKAHLKAEKRRKEGRVDPTGFPEEITAALAYFELNGFPMAAGPDADTINNAKRTLSRIFHPDRGGTHAEIVELNENCDVLLRFIG